jgi:hypothetical protein
MLYVGACKGEQELELIANLLDSIKEGLVFAELAFAEPAELAFVAFVAFVAFAALLPFCFWDGRGFLSKVSTLYASCNVE